ncbi:hypothetical protein JCM10908_006575 [Rhodotorula pacifica]|uniref:Ypt35p n=1 Tax=Rhodotorula pacifica TaxID=1495444 RepID=UPI00318000E3
MSHPPRPPPPPRSYTETVEEDVQQATSTALIDRAIPSAEPDAHGTKQTRAGHPARRSQSIVDLRLPGGWVSPRDDVGRLDDGRGGNSEPLQPPEGVQHGSTGTTAFTQARARLAPTSESLPRASSSASLLIRDGEDSSDEEADFASDDESFRFRAPSIASTSTSHRSSRLGVRVEDWSARPNSAFVKDVKITGYHTVGAESSGFVVFDVELQTLPTLQSQSTVMKLHKRYSSFAQLRHTLLSAHPQFRGLVPRLPPKSSLGESQPRVGVLKRALS